MQQLTCGQKTRGLLTSSCLIVTTCYYDAAGARGCHAVEMAARYDFTSCTEVVIKAETVFTSYTVTFKHDMPYI